MLVFVGIKMTLVDLYKIPSGVSLGVIASILAISIAALLWKSRKEESTAALAPRTEVRSPSR